MTFGAELTVTGLGLWIAGFPSASCWASGVPDEAATRPLGRALDSTNRRRASVLGRAVADAAAQALQASGDDPAAVATVVGSSIGEANTMVGLLDQMWRCQAPMSPAAFTVSVHNAASGLLSISSRNRGYNTSLAADHDTPAAALLEAVGLVHAGRGPVLVVCADEGTPASLLAEEHGWELLAAAVVVDDDRSARSPLARLAVLHGARADLAPAALPGALARNPQVGLFDVVDALLRGASGIVALDRGAGRGYAARLRAPGDRDCDTR